jgi:hypothetical protein
LPEPQIAGRFRRFLCRIPPVFAASDRFRAVFDWFFAAGFLSDVFGAISVIFQSVSSRTFLEPTGTDRNSPVLSGQESGGKETATKEVIPAGSGDG